uniref:Dynein light chain n=1 Tax=Quercus lobata TaxID=97700 RepID=A0A7N2R1B0_QUELO
MSLTYHHGIHGDNNDDWYMIIEPNIDISGDEFDSSYGPAWHCIVGTSFGSYVTHSIGGFLYFSIDKVYILLFKTAVEPLEQS